jgi:hypothetical protein
MRIELTTFALQVRRSNQLSYIGKGHLRESNPGPLPPKGRIIPLDQGASNMRRPGLEPGTPAWKADMLTPTPTTLFSTLSYL